jgi:hypothetical protein
MRTTTTEAGKYSRPQVNIYGEVKALTAAGTRGDKETTVSNPPKVCGTETDRRPC